MIAKITMQGPNTLPEFLLRNVLILILYDNFVRTMRNMKDNNMKVPIKMV